MNQQIELDRIRGLFLSAPESDATRILAVAGSLCLIAIVLWLVRRRSLREEHTPVWIAISLGLALVSVVPGMLNAITRMIGAWTPSSTLFFLGEVCLVLLCLSFAVRLSKTSGQLKELAQEVAILRAFQDEAADLSPVERSSPLRD
ncbi:MAG: DUF2304 domain-containing protein [bacterium]|nr:hypothetical protein [Deltaproteobacteria bacterium]MCP4904158.1 DUF2304 domain-containing protein [bacterium]